jgi:predicted nucleic-acid-binding Zn-ribbon protein
MKEEGMENQAAETERFRTLSKIGRVVSASGWIIMGGGGVVAFIIITAITGGRRGLSLGPTELVLMLALGFLPSALLGALIVAVGQTISCFVAIEENTRATWETQKAIFKALSRNDSPPPGGVPDRSVLGSTDQRPLKPPEEGPSRTVSLVTCPKCQENEAVQNRYDLNAYKKFEAVDKSAFGFQNISLTCRKCGYVFRI